jgi:hypothetical protein
LLSDLIAGSFRSNKAIGMVWFCAGFVVSCFCLTYIHGTIIINIYAKVKY